MRADEASGLLVVMAALGVVLVALLAAMAWIAHVAGSPVL